MANRMNYLGGEDWVNGDVLDATDLIETIKESSLFSRPIGSIVGWDKSLTGVPAFSAFTLRNRGRRILNQNI